MGLESLLITRCSLLFYTGGEKSSLTMEGKRTPRTSWGFRGSPPRTQVKSFGSKTKNEIRSIASRRANVPALSDLQDVGRCLHIGLRLYLLTLLAPDTSECLSQVRLDAAGVSERRIQNRFHALFL